MKYVNFFICFLVLIVFSCKKKEDIEINPCANGVKDAGEEEVDCGGTCKACYHYPYLVFKYNGNDVQSNDKHLIYDGTKWLLQSSFDTVQFQLNFGSNGEINTYTFSPVSTTCIAGQLPYTFVSGIYSINAHDLNKKTMSGNFDVVFARNFDTIKFESGQFEYLSY